jgi:hypothetical protein
MGLKNSPKPKGKNWLRAGNNRHENHGICAKALKADSRKAAKLAKKGGKNQDPVPEGNPVFSTSLRPWRLERVTPLA